MNYLYLLLPMLSVYLVGAFYPVRKEVGKDIPFRPPSWVFGLFSGVCSNEKQDEHILPQWLVKGQ